MSEDFLKRNQEELGGNNLFLKDVAHNNLLLTLNSFFEQHGHTNTEYGIQMPHPNFHFQELCNSLEFD